jgi:hypothetical protein
MRAAVLGIAVGLSALAGAGSPAQADNGLVGYWKMDEGAGIHVSDSSGYGNDGSLTGGVTWVPRGSGSALSFGGGSGYVQVPDNSSLEPPLSVSVGVWLRHVGSPGDYRYIIAKGAAGCTAASYALYTGPNGGLEFYVSRQHGAVYGRSPDAGQRVWDGNWHLAIGTFDGTTVRLYVDGAEVRSGTAYPGPLEYPLSTSNDLFIGAYPGCSAQPFSFAGDLDEVTVWNRPLSASTVQQMNQGGTPTAATGSPTRVSDGSPVQAGSHGSGSAQQTATAAQPALKLLAMQPYRFAVARSKGGKQPAGTTVSYIDSKAGLSTFTVLRRQTGVENRGRCIRPPRGHGSKPGLRCALWVVVGRFRHRDHAGVNRFRFNGRVQGRPLTPGAYLLDVVSRVGGVAGRPASVAFQVVG